MLLAGAATGIAPFDTVDPSQVVELFRTPTYFDDHCLVVDALSHWLRPDR